MSSHFQATKARPVMTSKERPAQEGNILLTTNVYGLRLNEQPMYRYDVNVIAYIKDFQKPSSLKAVPMVKKLSE